MASPYNPTVASSKTGSRVKLQGIPAANAVIPSQSFTAAKVGSVGGAKIPAAAAAKPPQAMKGFTGVANTFKQHEQRSGGVAHISMAPKGPGPMSIKP